MLRDTDSLLDFSSHRISESINRSLTSDTYARLAIKGLGLDGNKLFVSPNPTMQSDLPQVSEAEMRFLPRPGIRWACSMMTGPRVFLVNQRHLNPGQEQSRGAANAAIQPSFPRILAEDQGKPTDWAWVGTDVVFDGKKRG